MVFASITFLYWFLPAVVVLYFLFPSKWRNGVLLAASLLFYGWGEPKTLPVLCISVLIGYAAGLGMEYVAKKQRHRKILLWVAVLTEISFLLVFKYTDFFLTNWNRLTGSQIVLRQIALPVGISFYTFQIISYLIDVYRRKEAPQRNLLRFAMYISLFTQLVAGPIVRYTEMAGQMEKRVIHFTDIQIGIRRLVVGLSKKVLLADLIGECCQAAEKAAQPSVVLLWISAVGFTLQIYFDFSGYSDMAIGLGRIFGFRFPENFRYPYCADSITDFWRRWHISLGQWFRDYVYIPLGGNRCTTGKWLRNLLIVWFLTGFWHGAEWNFIIWGLYFALLLAAEKWMLRGSRGLAEGRRTQGKWLRHVCVIVLVVISFTIFRETNLHRLGTTLAGMFGCGRLPIVSRETIYILRNNFWLFLIAVMACTPLGTYVSERIRRGKRRKRIFGILEPFALLLLLLTATAYLVDGTYHPFLYFRF